MSALVWWLIPLVACSGALIYVWWSIAAKRRQDTFKSMAEYETFRSAFSPESPTKPESPKTRERASEEPEK